MLKFLVGHRFRGAAQIVRSSECLERRNRYHYDCRDNSLVRLSTIPPPNLNSHPSAKLNRQRPRLSKGSTWRTDRRIGGRHRRRQALFGLPEEFEREEELRRRGCFLPVVLRRWEKTREEMT